MHDMWKMFQMTSSQWSLFMRDRRRNKHRILTCGKTCAGKASSFKYPYLYDLNNRLKEVEKLWLS